MGLIARRFKFLQNIFPPGGALPPQPGFFEESISPVHQVLNGTDRLGEYFNFSLQGAAGVTSVVSGGASNDKYWFVWACHAEHDDPIARDIEIQILNIGVNFFGIANGTAIPTGIGLAVPRAFVLAPRNGVQATVPLLAAAQKITLNFQYLELDLGEPPPPFA